MYFRFCTSPSSPPSPDLLLHLCVVISVKNASRSGNIQGGNLASILSNPPSPYLPSSTYFNLRLLPPVRKYIDFSALLWPLTEYKHSVISPWILVSTLDHCCRSGLIGPARTPLRLLCYQGCPLTWLPVFKVVHLVPLFLLFLGLFTSNFLLASSICFLPP